MNYPARVRVMTDTVRGRCAVLVALWASSATLSCGTGGGTEPLQDASQVNGDSAPEGDSSGGGGPVDAGAVDGPPTSDSGSQPVDAAAARPSCPAQPPANGAACDAGQACAYVDCASYGHVSADCTGTAWTVLGTSCAPDGGWVACRDDHGSPVQMTCASDEVCRVYYSGAVIVTCVKNTCPPGLLSCECLDCASFGCHVTDSELSCGGGCGMCL